jgi:hypothetical protein
MLACSNFLHDSILARCTWHLDLNEVRVNRSRWGRGARRGVKIHGRQCTKLSPPTSLACPVEASDEHTLTRRDAFARCSADREKRNSASHSRAGPDDAVPSVVAVSGGSAGASTHKMQKIEVPEGGMFLPDRSPSCSGTSHPPSRRQSRGKQACRQAGGSKGRKAGGQSISLALSTSNACVWVRLGHGTTVRS